MKRPISPGEFIRDTVMPKYGVTQDQFAHMLHVSRFSVNQLINGKRNVTANMALRLERLTGLSAVDWMRMQIAIDLYDISIRDEKEISRIIPLASKYEVEEQAP